MTNGIHILRSGERLEIQLPPAGFRSAPFFFVLFSGFWLLYGLFSLNLLMVIQGSSILKLAFGGFTLGSLMLLCASLYLSFSVKTIELTPETVTIIRQGMGLRDVYTTYTDRVGPISMDEIHLRVLRRTYTFLTLHDVEKPHFFGAWLRPEDKAQILSVMKDYLQLQSHIGISYRHGRGEIKDKG